MLLAAVKSLTRLLASSSSTSIGIRLATALHHSSLLNGRWTQMTRSAIIKKSRSMTTNITMATSSDFSTSQSQLKKDAHKIFEKAVASVLPRTMVQKSIRVHDNTLMVDGTDYPLDNNVYIVGFGKAVLGMVQTAEELLGNHLVKGVASVPIGAQDRLQSGAEKLQVTEKLSRIEVIEGAQDNLPDADSNRAAQEIFNLAQSLKHGDILLVMISGGGSALLPLPCAPITLEEANETTRLLQRGGARIQTLNTFRKNIEVLKGGGLAQVAHPAKVISLILSDVIGDTLDMIASGPTVQNMSSAQQCLHIFSDLEIENKVPRSVLTFLQKRATNENSFKMASVSGYSPIDTYRSAYDSDQVCDWNQVHNVLIGSNSIAIQAAVEHAEALGYIPLVISDHIEGEAREVGVLLGKMAYFICESFKDKPHHKASNKSLIKAEISLIQAGMTKEKVKSLRRVVSQAQNSGQPLCLVCGGETTVSVKGQGQGGRNQEMALSAALEMSSLFADSSHLKNFNIQFLSAGTDGQDGPTDATGAFANPMTVNSNPQLNADEYLDDNDSYNYFKQASNGQDLLVTGPTGTNVMDLQFMLIKMCY